MTWENRLEAFKTAAAPLLERKKVIDQERAELWWTEGLAADRSDFNRSHAKTANRAGQVSRINKKLAALRLEFLGPMQKARA